MPSVPVSSPLKLAKAAAYGKLPFDRFVLDHWDYSKSVGKDQEQWNELAKTWLSMDHFARSSYWKTASSLENVPAGDSRMPTQGQIDRVLVPHQTVLERNLALRINDCLWLRTCYEPSLAAAYEELTRSILSSADDAHRVLDSEALYGSLGSDLAELFLRMPQLPDTVPYYGYPETEDLPFRDGPPDDQSMVPLYNAMVKEKLVIYLLDNEALQRNMLKVRWFDLGGNGVWWNWLSPSDTQSFEGHLFGLGHRLDYVLEMSDSDPALCEKGCIIQFD